MFDHSKFLEEIEEQGYAIIEGVVDKELIGRLKHDLNVAIRKEAEYQKTRDYPDYGKVHMCAVHGGSFLELLENEKLLDPIDAVLDEGCIIYAYISTSMPPSKGNFSSRIHVDRPRLIPGFREGFAALVLVSDFTEENGATWFLPGSHKWEDPPDEEYFYKNARRVLAPAGSVFFFDVRLWHAGGVNKTSDWRHAVAAGMVRPYMKQQFDLPRAMKGMDLSGVPDRVLQKLGFFAQVPTNLDEYYAPPEKRMYRQRSEWEKAEEERKKRMMSRQDKTVPMST